MTFNEFISLGTANWTPEVETMVFAPLALDGSSPQIKHIGIHTGQLLSIAQIVGQPQPL